MLEDDSSTTKWIDRYRAGDDEAARQLWERYAQRLQGLARRWLKTADPGQSFDEEDIAVSAFDALFRGLRDQRYPDLHGRDEFWRLLCVIALRKSNDRAKGERALKRSDPDHPVVTNSDEVSLATSGEPAPDVAAMMVEQCQGLLAELGEPDLERLVVLRLEGHTNGEIAALMGFSRRTIHRMLAIARDIWCTHLE